MASGNRLQAGDVERRSHLQLNGKGSRGKIKPRVKIQNTSPGFLDQLSKFSTGFFDDSPVQSPEILTGHEFDPDADILAAQRALPRDSSHSFFASVRPDDMNGLACLGGMFAPHKRAVAAHEDCFGILFPCAAYFFRTEAHRDCRHFSRTPPQVTAEFAGGKDDVEKLGPVEIIEILSCVFDLIRRSHALMDETAHRFRIREAQAGPLPNFFVFVKARVAHRDEMIPAECLTVERRGGGLATTCKTTLEQIRHFVGQAIGNIGIRLKLWAIPLASHSLILVFY